MNPDDLVRNMESLTRKLQEQGNDISEEALQDYLEEVSQSLNQVFDLVQLELDRGLEKIEEAKSCLLNEGLQDEARMVGSVVDHLSFAKQRLEIGQEVASQERDLELCPVEIERERLLTPEVSSKLEELALRIPT
jgi:predicted transcriptional regulator